MRGIHCLPVPLREVRALVVLNISPVSCGVRNGICCLTRPLAVRSPDANTEMLLVSATKSSELGNRASI